MLGRIARRASRIVHRPRYILRSSPYNSTIINNFYAQAPVFQSRNYASASGHGNEEGLFQTFIKMVKQNLQKNKEFEEAKKEFEESVAGKVTTTTVEAIKTTKDTTSAVVDKVKAPIGDVAKKIAESETVKQAVENTEKVIQRINEVKVVKAIVDEFTEEERAKREVFFNFRSNYQREKDRKEGIIYNPYTKKLEKLEDANVDAKTMEVTLVTDRKRNRSSIVEKTGLGGVVETVGKKLLSSEHSEVFTYLKERDPEFSIQKLLWQMEYHVIPNVLNAYFRDDEAELRRYVSTACWKQQLYPRIHMRKHSKTKFDTSILQIKDVDLYSASFHGDEPILVVTANVQYIFCVKEIATGKVVEGSPTDIREENVMWILQQDVSGETNDWEILELSFGSSIRINV